MSSNVWTTALRFIKIKYLDVNMKLFTLRAIIFAFAAIMQLNKYPTTDYVQKERVSKPMKTQKRSNYFGWTDHSKLLRGHLESIETGLCQLFWPVNHLVYQLLPWKTKETENGVTLSILVMSKVEIQVVVTFDVDDDDVTLVSLPLPTSTSPSVSWLETR